MRGFMGLFPSRSLMFIAGLGMAGLQANTAHATLDPELAQAAAKNDGGFFLGGNMGFGQARPTDGSTPGVGYNVNVEPGFAFRRDSWNRIEASLQLGAGHISASNSTGDVNIPIGFQALARFGYGYSLGGSIFGVLRGGVGLANAIFKQSTSTSVSYQSNGTLWGTIGQLGFDIVAPMNDTLDLVAGLELTHYQYSIGDVKDSDGNVYKDEGGPYDINVPQLSVGLRLKF